MLVALSLADAVVGVYLLWYAVRRQRENRAHLAFVGVVLLGCALTLAVLALPDNKPQPGRVPPLPGQLV